MIYFLNQHEKFYIYVNYFVLDQKYDVNIVEFNKHQQQTYEIINNITL